MTCDLLRILETSEQTNYQRDDKYSPLTKSSLKVSFHQAPLNDSCPPVNRNLKQVSVTFYNSLLICRRGVSSQLQEEEEEEETQNSSGVQTEWMWVFRLCQQQLLHFNLFTVTANCLCVCVSPPSCRILRSTCAVTASLLRHVSVML